MTGHRPAPPNRRRRPRRRATGALVAGALLSLAAVVVSGAPTGAAPRSTAPRPAPITPAATSAVPHPLTGIPLRPVPVTGAPLPDDASPPVTGWGKLAGEACPTRAADTIVVRVAKDRTLDGTWATYGDGGAEWNGGDSVHAYALGPKELLWTFADSFVGPVTRRGTRNPNAALYHNLFVVQSGDRFHTVIGGVPGLPSSLYGAAISPDVYLSLASLQTGNELQEFLLELLAPPGQQAVQLPLGTLVATYALPSLRLLSVQGLADETAAVQWGAAVIQWAGSTYVYGTTTDGDDKSLYVARVMGTDLDQPWQYWAGTGWSADPSAAAAVASGVSGEVSVTQVDGMFVLVTTPTTTSYSPLILFAMACSPTGPFWPTSIIRASYATGSVGKRYYGVSDVYDYDAIDQPAFNRGSTWLISYDQNVLNYDELARNVAIYRPSYLWVQLGPRPTKA